MNSMKNVLARLTSGSEPVALLLVFSLFVGSSFVGCNSEQQVDKAVKKMNDETELMNKQATANKMIMLAALEGAVWSELVKTIANGDEAEIANAKEEFFKSPQAAAKRLVDIYSAPNDVEDDELRTAIELAAEFVDSSKNSTHAESIVEPLFLFRFSKQSAEKKQLAAESFDQCVDFAIKHGTQNPLFFVSRGNRLFEKQKLDLAVNDFTRAIELDPKTESAFIGRCNVRLAKLDYPQAADDLNHAIEINPDNFQTRYLRAVALIQIDDSEKALIDLNRTIELNPKFVPPLKFRSQIYRTQGDTEKAEADLKLAQELEAGQN